MIEWIADRLSLAELWQARLVLSAAIVVVLILIRTLVVALVHRRVSDETLWYRSRKTVDYIAGFTAFVLLFQVWFEGGQFNTYLGLVSAGIAIALSDVLKNFAGWAFIMLRRPFRVGDRVEINGHIGDVVDVAIFKFTVLEIGNWVDADQSTGRILHIPNGLVFTHPVANSTTAFPYVWHEIPMLVTFESDWEAAESMMQRTLESHAPDMASREARAAIRSVATEFQIRYTHLTPTTYVTVRDSGVLVTGRLLVPARSRRGIEAGIWKALLKELAADPSVQLAYPTVRTFLPDRLRWEGPPTG